MIEYTSDPIIESAYRAKRGLCLDRGGEVALEEVSSRLLRDLRHVFGWSAWVFECNWAVASRHPSFEGDASFPEEASILPPLRYPASGELGEEAANQSANESKQWREQFSPIHTYIVI